MYNLPKLEFIFIFTQIPWHILKEKKICNREHDAGLWSVEWRKHLIQICLISIKKGQKRFFVNYNSYEINNEFEKLIPNDILKIICITVFTCYKYIIQWKYEIFDSRYLDQWIVY